MSIKNNSKYQSTHSSPKSYRASLCLEKLISSVRKGEQWDEYGILTFYKNVRDSAVVKRIQMGRARQKIQSTLTSMISCRM